MYRCFNSILTTDSDQFLKFFIIPLCNAEAKICKFLDDGAEHQEHLLKMFLNLLIFCFLCSLLLLFIQLFSKHAVSSESVGASSFNVSTTQHNDVLYNNCKKICTWKIRIPYILLLSSMNWKKGSREQGLTTRTTVGAGSNDT